MDDDDYEYIDENHRIGAEQDETAWQDPPTSWGNIVVVPMSRSYWNRPYPDAYITEVIGTDWINLGGAIDRFIHTWGDGHKRGEREVSIEAVIRWARIFHNVFVDYDSETDAFWFVPEESFKFYTDPVNAGWPNPDSTPLDAQAEIVGQEQRTYHKWGEGEVYVIFAQEKHVKHITVKSADQSEVIREYDRETWDTEDSIGGVYIDGFGSAFRDEMLQYAKDYFDDKYTKKEEAK